MELPLMYENSIAGTEAMWKLYKEGLLDKWGAQYFGIEKYSADLVDRDP